MCIWGQIAGAMRRRLYVVDAQLKHNATELDFTKNAQSRPNTQHASSPLYAQKTVNYGQHLVLTLTLIVNP